ncbi:MAG: FHA domain-containing protein [Actinomycetota bacterium]
MAPVALKVLQWVFLALLYLFLLRAIRVITLDVFGPRQAKTPHPGPAAHRPRVPASRRKPPRTLHLVQGEPAGAKAPLEGPITLGRGEECTIVLEDTYVSTLHARLYPKEATWMVEDLGSTNGTFLNRIKLSGPAEVAAGDQIRVGKTVLELRR